MLRYTLTVNEIFLHDHVHEIENIRDSVDGPHTVGYRSTVALSLGLALYALRSTVRDRAVYGWNPLRARSIMLHKKICIEHAARACFWLHGAGYLRNVQVHAYSRGHTPGVFFGTRGHGPPSCPNTSKRKRAMICGERFGRGLRSSYSARRSAASATPGADKLRSPRRICW